MKNRSFCSDPLREATTALSSTKTKEKEKISGENKMGESYTLTSA
jgi:hypothetical protein